MDFYQALGELILGTRLKRLSERWLVDVAKTYQAFDIDFEASWFPVFFILEKSEKVTLSEISSQLEISHSAVSQMATQLEKKGLVKIRKDKNDKRKRLIAFTEKGEQLARRAKLIWMSMERSVREMMLEGPHSSFLIPALDEIEEAMERDSLFNRMNHEVKQLLREKIRIEEVRKDELGQLDSTFQHWMKSDSYFHENYGKLDWNTAVMYAARVEENLVGVIAATFHEGSATISLLFVPPEFRKQEIGNSLLDAILDRLRENKLSKVLVELERDQTMLIHFFKKHGLLLGASQDEDYRERLEKRTVLLTLPTEETVKP